MKAFRMLFIFAAMGASFVLALNISFVGAAVTALSGDRLAYGLSAGGKALGGMSREEAREELSLIAEQKLLSSALILRYGEREWDFSASEVGLSADVDAAVETAFAVGREGGFWQRAVDAARCVLYGREAGLVPSLDEAKLASAIRKVAAEIKTEPVDAWCTLGESGVERHHGTVGKDLDAAELAESLAEPLLALRLPQEVEIEPKSIEPSVRDEDVAPIDSVLSVYSTYYAPYGNRGANIEIAAAALDGVLVRAGGELSFNDTVGWRVASAGYLDAPVIINGKIEQDIGGGVCQVSSTLYNAVLLADLTPTDRTSHFYPSAYVPAGLDATVADGQIDFRFKNTLPHSVYILSRAGSGTLTIYVLGRGADLPGEIALETEIVGPNPTVDVYRVTYAADREEREYLHTDEYDIPPPPESTNGAGTAV